MYKYTVVEQDLYKKSVKKLSKNYKNIETDIKNYLKSIKIQEDLGIELKTNIEDFRFLLKKCG